MSTAITVYAVSDMTGETVERIVRAASAQFPHDHVTIKVLQHIQSFPGSTASSSVPRGRQRKPLP